MVGMLEHPSLGIAGLALEFWGMLGELLTKTADGGGGVGGTGQRSPALEESVRHACRWGFRTVWHATFRVDSSVFFPMVCGVVWRLLCEVCEPIRSLARAVRAGVIQHRQQ